MVLYVAVVRDTDGSAFITKAEFDSLKNNFQAQIDNYNSSIDSKIDGAIASYLSGIKISSDTYIPIIAIDNGDGILSCRGREDLKWVEGRPYGSITYESSRAYMNVSDPDEVTTGSPASVKFKIVASRSNAFPSKVLGVANARYDKIAADPNNSAEWIGTYDQLERIIIVVANQSRQTTYATLGSYFSNDTMLFAPHLRIDEIPNLSGPGWVPLSNVQTGADGSHDGRALSARLLRNYYGNHSWALTVWQDQIFPDRSLSNLANTSIVLPSYDMNEHRFTDTVNNVNFWNDTEVDGHTTGHDAWEGFWENMEYDIFYHEIHTDISGVTGIRGVDWTPGNGGVYGYGVDVGKINYALPTFGFVSNLQNYNKLWTRNYDRYLSDMLTCHSDLNIFTASQTGDGSAHLKLTAGVPIGKVKKDTEARIPFRFLDSSEHWFAVRLGSYNGVTKPYQDTLNLIGKSSDGSAIWNDTYKMYYITGTDEVTLCYDIPDDGYLFCMWGRTDSGWNGGGRIKFASDFIQRTIN